MSRRTLLMLFFFCGFELLWSQQEIPGFKFVEKNAQGYSVYQHIGQVSKTATNLRFVLIPKGKFQMGSLNEKGRSIDELYHQVKITFDFLIAEAEISQKTWLAIMQTSPWKVEKGKEFVKEGENYPAIYLSWEECQQFCEKTGLKLPTEAMWEYACRGNTQTTYYWGNEMDGAYAWYLDNAWNKGEKWAHPIQQKKPNPYGLYDMIGNVWEWCQDTYQNYNIEEIDHFYPKKDMGKKGDLRVNRGGGFFLEPQDCRAAVRNAIPSDSKGFGLGFRPVFIVETK